MAECSSGDSKTEAEVWDCEITILGPQASWGQLDGLC